MSKQIIAVGYIQDGVIEMDIALPAQTNDYEQGRRDFWRGVCRVGASEEYIRGWDAESDEAYADLCKERAENYDKYTSWMWS